MDRIFEIIKVLLNSEGYLTVDQIAESLKVSNKTIRNELSKVQEYVAGKKLVLSKKAGVGIAIEGNEKDRLNLIDEVKGLKSAPEPFTPDARKDYLLKRLLINDDNITIKELSEELFVSRVTIQKDLEEVEQWLQEFDLKLLKKTNFGIQVIGKEENWRNAVISLIYSKKESEELKSLLYEDYSGRIDYKTIQKLKEIINLDFKQLEKIVSSAEKKLKFNFSDEAFISLVIHIAIAIKRLKHKKDIQLSLEMIKGLREQEEYGIAESIAFEIQEVFKVKLPESEIGYILLHILGAKMQQNITEESDLPLIDKVENDLSLVMAKEIIAMAEKILSIDLKGDMQLLNGLVLHLRPTINRLKYDLTLRNPMIDEIKEGYPEIFGVAWMTSSIFEKYIAKKISEEEIGYIALHLGAAVERQKVHLKVLVVCTSGIGTSQLLAARLERHFRDIDIKDIVSSASLMEEKFTGIDMIISTVPLQVSIPAINISPLLNQNDIKRLDLFIQEISRSKSKLHHSIRALFNEELIEPEGVFEDKDSILRELSNRLYERSYVKAEFFKNVMDREKLTVTAVGNGVAIPHGEPAYVNKSQIAVMRLIEPIKWGEETVDIVFMICISELDLPRCKKLFRILYNKIDSFEFLKNLRGAKNKEEMMKILEGIDDAN